MHITACIPACLQGRRCRQGDHDTPIQSQFVPSHSATKPMASSYEEVISLPACCRDTAAEVGRTTLEGGKEADTSALAPSHGAPDELQSRAEREEISAQGPLQVMHSLQLACFANFLSLHD